MIADMLCDSSAKRSSFLFASQGRRNVEEQACSVSDEMFYLFVKAVGAVQLLCSTAVPADVLVTDQAELVIVVLQ